MALSIIFRIHVLENLLSVPTVLVESPGSVIALARFCMLVTRHHLVYELIEVRTFRFPISVKYTLSGGDYLIQNFRFGLVTPNQCTSIRLFWRLPDCALFVPQLRVELSTGCSLSP